MPGLQERPWCEGDFATAIGVDRG